MLYEVITATGSGIYTTKGLASGDYYAVGDDNKGMIKLYGEDYYERPLSYNFV